MTSTHTNPVRSRRTRVTAGVLAAAGLATGISAVAPGAAQADHYWGAIAVGSQGQWGRALDYPTQDLAESVALAYCDGACEVLAVFANGCGAVAETATMYIGATGSTLSSAQNRALSEGGYIYTWACTSS